MSTPSGAGRRDRFITVQQNSDSIGGSRFPVENWTTLRQVWAMKREATGTERFAANQLSAPYDVIWEIPYTSDMDPNDPVVNVPKNRRIVYQGRVFDIVAAEEIGRRRGVLLRTLAGGLVS